MNPDALFDAVVHVTMLWTLLLAFFVLYASKVEKAAFKQQFATLIQGGLGAPSVESLLLQAKGLAPQLQSLEPGLQRPDPEVTANNNSVVRTGVLVAAALVGILAAILYTTPHIPVAEILKENATVFALVAVVEYAFFSGIVTKYVPTAPSTMLDSALGALQN